MKYLLSKYIKKTILFSRYFSGYGARFAWPAWVLGGAFLLGGASPLFADRFQDRFDYNGNLYFQGFYLKRDLPLVRPEELEQIDPVTLQSLTYPYQSVCSSPSYIRQQYNPAADSRCKEKEDFYRMRMRLNLAFRASENVDILYGMEVGYITFGREENTYGPGSGGKGAGRTNLETQKMILNIHDEKKVKSVSAGVFNYSTPGGLVAANSGAGFRGNYLSSSLNSNFEAIYIRSEDNSRVDNDSNGFSDTNYRDVNLGIAKWVFNGIRSLRTELYGVARKDNDPSLDDSSVSEISRMFWGGLYLDYRLGSFKFILHGVVNRGSFERPDRFGYLSAYERIMVLGHLDSAGYQINPVLEPVDLKNVVGVYQAPAGITGYGDTEDFFLQNIPWKKHRVNAGAGQLEIVYNINDAMRISAKGAWGSGRLGVEPDGSLSDYRSDQFRTAGRAFQFSDIAVDSSGGYSIFSLGNLTGIQIRGLVYEFRIFKNLEAGISYFAIDLNHDPVMHFNAYHTPYPAYVNATVDPGTGQINLALDWNTAFTGHPGLRKKDRYLGEEWNGKVTWRLWSGFSVIARAAWFDAGDGYKILKDVQYGDDIYEYSVALNQDF